jgi:hypothetical protein
MAVQRDVVRLIVEAAREDLRPFVAACGRHRGLQVQALAASVSLTVASERIETLGPRIEAAARAHRAALRLEDLDAEIPPTELDDRPSRLWAAIGNAADERAVARERGKEPHVDLFQYVRIEEHDGRRVAYDNRKPLVDPVGPMPADLSPTKFDDASWHADAADAAGQPGDNAWTHLALYLTWLIRNDLVDATRIRPTDIRAVKEGAVVGRSVMQWIDGKLVSDLMTDAGASFSTAR